MKYLLALILCASCAFGQFKLTTPQGITALTKRVSSSQTNLWYKIIEITGGNSSVGISDYNGHAYMGGTLTLSSNMNITRVSFDLTKAGGDISAKSYTCYIYTLSGANLNTIVGTSTAVLGDNAWNVTKVDFTFSVPVAVTSGVKYAYVLNTTVDGSNYASTKFGGAQGVQLCDYNALGVNQNEYPFSPNFVLWGY